MDQKALTIRFWNLQLLLMEYPERTVKSVAFGMITYSENYKRNNFTQKAIKLTKKQRLTRKEHNCLSTHIALQVVGIYE